MSKIHNSQYKYFQNIVKNGQLGHAYLFCGPEGVGKKDFAFEFFRLVNNRNPEGDPDFKLLTPHIEEDKTTIPIGDIRELKNFLSFKPYFGPYKFVVINDADHLTAEAANSILKVLEEPSPFSVLVLVSSKPKTILLTVLSRCEMVRFFRLEKIEPDKETLKAIDEFVKVCKEGIAKRMVYADKLHKKGDYQRLVVGLIHWLHARDKKNLRVMKSLLKLNDTLSQPQFNHRLALENFLINL